MTPKQITGSKRKISAIDSLNTSHETGTIVQSKKRRVTTSIKQESSVHSRVLPTPPPASAVSVTCEEQMTPLVSRKNRKRRINRVIAPEITEPATPNSNNSHSSTQTTTSSPVKTETKAIPLSETLTRKKLFGSITSELESEETSNNSSNTAAFSPISTPKKRKRNKKRKSEQHTTEETPKKIVLSPTFISQQSPRPITPQNSRTQSTSTKSPATNPVDSITQSTPNQTPIVSRKSTRTRRRFSDYPSVVSPDLKPKQSPKLQSTPTKQSPSITANVSHQSQLLSDTTNLTMDIETPVVSRKNRKRLHRSVVAVVENADEQNLREETKEKSQPTLIFTRKGRISRRHSAVSELSTTTTTTSITNETPINIYHSPMKDNHMQDQKQGTPPKAIAAPSLLNHHGISKSETRVDTSSVANIQQPKQITPMKLTEYITELENARKVVSCSFSVSGLAQRDTETYFVREKLESCLESNIGTSLILAGQPGTGKTACTRLIIQSISSISSLEMNCMEFRKIDFIKKIAHFFGCSVEGTTEDIRDRIKEKLFRMRQFHVIMLDEIESVPDQELLKELLKISKTLPLMIIGITNDVNDVSAWKQEFTHLLSFSPYTKDQMKSILANRLEDYIHLFSKPVLEYIANKTYDGGSARTSLNITEASIGSAIIELKEMLSKQGDISPEKPYQIQLKHVQPHLKNSLTISRNVDSIKSLPSAQKMLLCACFKLMKGEKKEFTIAGLSSFYNVLKKHPELEQMLTQLQSAQIQRFCVSLQDVDLITIVVPRGKKKITPECKISINLSESDMEAALGNMTWYRKIMEMKK